MTAAAVLLGLGLVACGADDGTTATTVAVTTVAPATTAPATTTAPTTTAPVTTAPTTTVAPTTAAPTTATTAAPTTTIVGGPTVISLTVGTDDATTLGERTEIVPLGTDLRLELVAPEAEEYHLHGYDIEQEAPAGQPVAISFTADQAGEFPLESHLTDDLLLTLVVE